MKRVYVILILSFLVFYSKIDAQKIAINKIDTSTNIKTGLDTTDITTNFPINKPEDIRVTLNTDGTAVIDITGAGGQTQKIPVEKLPTTIKDSEGTLYSVDKHGKVTKVGKAGAFKTIDFAKLNTINTDKAVVTFVAHDGQKYAFDQWKEVYNKSQLYKEKYEYLNGYRVSSKAIEAGKTDLVRARINISDRSIKPDSVRFVTSKGTRYESKYLGNTEYEITVVGGPAKDAQELYAIYATDNNNYLSFGKLLISSYPHQKQKLVLVPVNGATVDKNKIADELNKIYNKIAVEFDVQQDVNFSDNTWDKKGDGLDVDGSGLFSTLTSEMKALNKAYRDSKRPIDKSTIYLFVLSKSNPQGVVGDMPRNKQFGYLFTGNDGKTVAHEVGHGLFNLKHTFDSQYGFAKGELGNNVMDYPNGDQFSKLQWDAVHDPGLVFGVFEGDGDAMSFINTPKPKAKGKQEGQTQTTNNGGYKCPSDATGCDPDSPDAYHETKWNWHEGGVRPYKYNGKISEVGWYDIDEYTKILQPLAQDLAGYKGLFSNAASVSCHNWTATEKANIANTELGKFIGKNISDNTINILASSAYKYANDRNFAVSGYTAPSSFNVEDILLLTILIKDLAGVIVKSVGTKAVGKLGALIDDALIIELKATGVKFTETDLKFIAKNNDNLIMFLEKGNSNAGLQHIIDGKWTGKPDFQALFNNSIDEMVENLFKAIKDGNYVEKIVDNQNRLSYVYKVQTTQGLRQFKIATGSNGYIVSFIPNWK